MVKRCPHCSAVKPLSEFTPDKSKASGYMSWCKDCVNARCRSYYQRTNGEKSRARYQADPEKRKAQVRAWRAANPDRARQLARDQYYRRPRQVRRKEGRERYMKRHGGMEEWARLYDEQHGLCYLCLQPLPADGKDVHVDHDHSCCDAGPRDSTSCRYCRRGLTHQACNQIWGLAKENPALLRIMADQGGRVKDETRRRIAMKAFEQEALL